MTDEMETTRIANRNVALAVCERHADAVTRAALLEMKSGGVSRYTFGGLDYLSDKLAGVLRGRGVEEGEVVALCLPGSAAMAVGQLAVLKAGAVVAPLPFSASDATLEMILRETPPAAIIADARRREPFCNVARRFFTIDAPRTLAFEENEFDFWRETAGAASDFAALPAPGAFAFLFHEPAADSTFTKSFVTHEECLAAMSAGGQSNAGVAESTVEAPADWAARDSLLGSIYPAWWAGQAVIIGAGGRA